MRDSTPESRLRIGMGVPVRLERRTRNAEISDSRR
jgi:hypothetical protein